MAGLAEVVVGNLELEGVLGEAALLGNLPGALSLAIRHLTSNPGAVSKRTMRTPTAVRPHKADTHAVPGLVMACAEESASAEGTVPRYLSKQ